MKKYNFREPNFYKIKMVLYAILSALFIACMVAFMIIQDESITTTIVFLLSFVGFVVSFFEVGKYVELTTLAGEYRDFIEELYMAEHAEPEDVSRLTAEFFYDYEMWQQKNCRALNKLKN